MENKIFIAEVLSVDDEFDGERIKVRIRPNDNNMPVSKIPYAFPLLPKMIHIKPKVGESVFIICNGEDANTQRYYIGPIISQPQFMYKANYGTNKTTSLLKGGAFSAQESQKQKTGTDGAFIKDDEIAIIGRKSTQIVMSDDDIRIRCGVSNIKTNTDEIGFNKVSPSFLKMKFYENGKQFNNETISSVVTLVGDKINLIGNNGNPYFNTADKTESISDEEMEKILTNAHQLPYGDVLCDLLGLFYEMFKAHVHNYGPSAPVSTWQQLSFENKYGGTSEAIKDKILSKTVRIN